MTKAKAMEQMLENSRAVVDPIFARKIAKAFGYTLSQLGIKPRKTKDFNRINYSEATANLPSIAIYELARQLAEHKSGTMISSMMNGSGSYAQDITEKSVEILRGANVNDNNYLPLKNRVEDIADGILNS